MAASEIFEKTAQSNEMIGLGEDGETEIILIMVAIETETIFAKDFRGDVAGFDVAVKIFAGKFQKASQIKAVVVDSAARATIFYL